jgi:hypothetical protein
MPAQDLSLDSIEDFLAQRRIAMVGISREPGSYSVQQFKELSRRGCDVVPVNPKTPNIHGRGRENKDSEPEITSLCLQVAGEQDGKRLQQVIGELDRVDQPSGNFEHT